MGWLGLGWQTTSRGNRGALADGTGQWHSADSGDGRWRGGGGRRLERLCRAGNTIGGSGERGAHQKIGQW
jgi:hypothetical protein